MIPRLKYVALELTLVALYCGGYAAAGEVLGGIPGLACEARLCLSTGSPPSECQRSLSYYYGIRGKDAARRRQEFLNKCPLVSGSAAPGCGGVVPVGFVICEYFQDERGEYHVRRRP